MKRNAQLVGAVLVGALLGFIAGWITGPQPTPEPDPDSALNLVPDRETGCVTVSVAPDSYDTFLIVEVHPERSGQKTVERTGRFTFMTRDSGEEEFCGRRSAASTEATAEGEAAADAADDKADEGDSAHIKVFKLKKAGECKKDVCVDHFEDYPVPWPPGS